MPKFDLGTLVNAVAAGSRFASARPQAEMQKIFSDVQAFGGSILNAAATRWMPFFAEQHPCHIMQGHAGVAVPCMAHAILPCMACGKPTCMNHAQVDATGAGTCLACIVELMQMKRGGPRAAPPHAGTPPQDASGDPRAAQAEAARKELKRQALKELGLGPTATLAEASKAHRILAAKFHPDKQKTQGAKARVAERAIKVNAAFATLKQIFEAEGKTA